MSDDEEVSRRDDDDSVVIVVDAGGVEWRAGLATDDGPSVLLAEVTATEKTWRTTFERLEVDPASTLILLSEQPGTSASQREQTAALLFEKLGVQALLIAAPTLLTLYATDRVTGVVVDVGERSTIIQPVYEGCAVLEAATAIDLGGWHVSSWLADQMAKPAFAKAGFRPASREDAERVARRLKEKHARIALDGQGGAPDAEF